MPEYKNLRFQVAGRQRLKYCRSLPLGLEMKQLFGRDINRIIPPEMKEKGFVPVISIYRDNDNNNIVLHCSLVERQDDTTQTNEVSELKGRTPELTGRQPELKDDRGAISIAAV